MPMLEFRNVPPVETFDGAVCLASHCTTNHGFDVWDHPVGQSSVAVWCDKATWVTELVSDEFRSDEIHCGHLTEGFYDTALNEANDV